MKKKIIVIFAAVMLGTAVTTVILMKSKSLGNISMNIPVGEAKTAVSEISFKGKVGERIRISLSTDIKNGAVNFVLYNSKGGVVENIGTAKAYQTFVDLYVDDTYTLAAEYTDFTGSFKADVSKKIF
ncbi:MAG: hypothetical protein K2N26_00200 [Oscillospiraceae bacterium]|nr:hypothetical protein [Oscillospiraceae bacterium]